MKRAIFGILIFLAVAALVWAGFFYASESPEEVAPVADGQAANVSESGEPSPATGASGENLTDFPLELPAGFSISVFAENIPMARVMVFDSDGNLWVSRTRAGAIAMLEIKDGAVASQNDIFRNLRNPHGLAFDPDDPNMLYFAEEHRVSRVPLRTEASPEKIADLPFGAGHSTRTLLFGSDGRLYVSIGSSCNVCVETDPRRAAVYSMEKDGSDFRQFASGLRNSVFMINHPETGEIWATDMGRDRLGDNVPPEEVNILKQGQDYGWPYCYGQNIHDDNFDPAGRVSCEGKTPPIIEMQAHSAPLGLAFVPENSNWPEEYENNLLIAYHGSWNRSAATGYKVVRFDVDREGNVSEGEQNFIAGWLEGSDGDAALGRPVEIIFHDNAMYLSDDKAGVIYKIIYTER